MGWSEELELAQRAFSVGEVPHALNHLGAALMLAPTEERVAAAIEKAAAERSLLEHVEDVPFVGNQLLRAWLMRRAGRIDEALSVMSALVRSFPNHRFEVITASWLIAAQAAGQKLNAATQGALVQALSIATEGTIGLNRLRAGQQELLSGFEPLADVLLELEGDENVPWVCSGVYRRLGQTKKALAAVEGLTTSFALIQRGLALRAAGDVSAAFTEFETASRLPTAGVSEQLELVRCHYLLGEGAKGLARLDTLGRLDGESSALRALCAGAAPATLDEGLTRLDLVRRRSFSVPPECPPDATANLFVQHAAQLEAGKTKLKVSISGWESPSNQLLAALFATGTSDTLQADVTMSLPPPFERDPRAQTRGARAPTWKWVDERPVQFGAAPSVELRARLAELAGQGDDFFVIEGRVRAAALTASADELMRAMVHAPVEAAWLATLPHGLMRYQLAAACALAAKPWSECGAAFESLLFGPVDWCSASAVVALAERVRREADGAREGHELLCSASRDLVMHACEPRGAALGATLGQVPCVPQEVKKAVGDWFEATQPKEEPAPDESRHFDVAPETKPKPAVAAPVRAEVAPVAAGGRGWLLIVAIIVALAALVVLSAK